MVDVRRRGRDVSRRTIRPLAEIRMIDRGMPRLERGEKSARGHRSGSTARRATQRKLKFTGTSTVLAAATPRTMRGLKRQRRTADSAAWSRTP